MPVKNTSLPPFDSTEYRQLIDQWLKNERFVAAVDAFVQGYGNMLDVGNRGFESYPPAMIASDLLNIVADVAARLVQRSSSW